MKHYHYQIQGYEKLTKESNLLDSITIDVLGISEKTAMKEAKKLCNKKHYRTARITECFGSHGEELTRMANVFEKSLKRG